MRDIDIVKEPFSLTFLVLYDIIGKVDRNLLLTSEVKIRNKILSFHV